MVGASTLFLAALDAESYQIMVYAFSVGYMYVFLRPLSKSRCQTLSGIGRKFQTQFSVPKMSGHCYWHEVSQGADATCALMNVPHRHHRFTALSGMYFSLKYLSFSDAVVLKFLAPILTAFSGAMFLQERLSLKQIVASRKHFQ